MRNSIANILRFALLLFLQVVIMNNINFGGYINPQIYILYVFLFPYYNKHRSFFILSSFFLGLSIDFFMNSGGINAFSLTLIAYLRPSIFNIIMGNQAVNDKLSLRELPFSKSITYVLLLTFFHHTALFWLENFSFDELGIMFFRILLSTLYSTVFILISLSLFFRKKQ
ncbi:MAG: rod shape-determining protein MreD [Flavobacteriales bacterium]|nr:rod shape-determining protein MreD [Flavobacteriales bacterium]